MDRALTAFYYELFGESKKILDLGCGLGDLGRFKSNSVQMIYGLDHNINALREAKRYYLGVIFSDLNEGSLPFSKNFFDVILAKDILEHLSSPWRIVQEMYRILCPGGIALAQVPMPKARVVWNDYTHVRGFTKSSLKKLFEDHGFVTLSICKMGGIPLAGRLNMVGCIPMLLKLPFFNYLFGSSFLIRIRKLPEK